MNIVLSSIVWVAVATMSWQAAPPPAAKEASWILHISQEQEDFSHADKCQSGEFRFGVRVHSELTVGENGGVTYRETRNCQGPGKDTSHGQSTTGVAATRVYTAQLSPADLRDLTDFLNSQEVKEIRDFMNQSPILDNYEIQIKRGKDTQHVTVFAFMPEHFELRERPALTQLICRGKKLAGQASHSTEMPDYCPCAEKR